MSNRPGRAIARQQSRARARSSRTRDSHVRQQRLVVVVIAVIVGVGVAVGVVGALVSGNDDDSSTFAMNGGQLPPYQAEAAVDPAVGTKAPIVVTTDLAGERIVTGSGGGPNDTAKVIGFFAHWCPHCQAELPRVTAWLAENALPDRVEVIVVSTLEDESRGNYPPRQWFDSVGWTHQVLVDTSSNEVAEAFGMQGVPYWVVLDDFNTVLARASGELDTRTFESLVALAASGVH
jgi:thiol-disulfide isomerase/thioredoxin